MNLRVINQVKTKEKDFKNLMIRDKSERRGNESR